MSESVRQLLVRGIAAAKSAVSNDHAESRTYLKQALRSPDATAEQKATAWLGLSQLENDIADKQFCLDQALELDPNNILAQRGLIILRRHLKSHNLLPITSTALCCGFNHTNWFYCQCGSLATAFMIRFIDWS